MAGVLVDSSQGSVFLPDFLGDYKDPFSIVLMATGLAGLVATVVSTIFAAFKNQNQDRNCCFKATVYTVTSIACLFIGVMLKIANPQRVEVSGLMP